MTSSPNTTLLLPSIPPLQCGGDMTGQIDRYMTRLGDSIAQISLHASNIDSSVLINTALNIENAFNRITGVFVTDPLPGFNSHSVCMKYRARELCNDIDVFLQKRIIEAATDLLQFLGMPTPLDLPVPFLTGVVLIDLFSKSGKLRIRQAINTDYERLKSTFTGDVQIDAHIGEWSHNSPAHATEEIWHKIQRKINELLNNFMISLINTLFGTLSKIPGLETLEAFVDPTIGIETSINLLYASAKDKFKSSIPTLSNISLTAHASVREFINIMANFPLPLVGSVGVLIDFDIDKEIKRSKMSHPELTMAHVHSNFKGAVEKIKRTAATEWINMMYELIMKLPGEIIDQFPILDKIIKWIEPIIEIITGKIDPCQVIKILMPGLFDMESIIASLIPTGISITFTEYGYLPPDVI
jgi:hypothetical protein